MRLAILLAHGYTSEKNTGTKPTMFASPKRPKLIVATPANNANMTHITGNSQRSLKEASVPKSVSTAERLDAAPRSAYLL
jgi:hypothetical protein